MTVFDKDSSAKCCLVLERQTKLQNHWLSVKPEPGEEFVDTVFIEKTRSRRKMNMREMIRILPVSGKKIW